MIYFNTHINPIHRKQLSRYFGMPLSSISTQDSIMNLFFMYYIPENDKETYAINNRKEAAFFGMTFFCNTERAVADSNAKFEDKLSTLYTAASDTCKQKIESIFLSHMCTTQEYIITLGNILRRPENFEKIKDISIQWY